VSLHVLAPALEQHFGLSQLKLHWAFLRKYTMDGRVEFPARLLIFSHARAPLCMPRAPLSVVAIANTSRCCFKNNNIFFIFFGRFHSQVHRDSSAATVNLLLSDPSDFSGAELYLLPNEHKVTPLQSCIDQRTKTFQACGPIRSNNFSWLDMFPFSCVLHYFLWCVCVFVMMMIARRPTARRCLASDGAQGADSWSPKEFKKKLPDALLRRNYAVPYQQGQCCMHLGKRLHGVLPLTSGARYTLILMYLP
jgi:hypothetical protein